MKNCIPPDYCTPPHGNNPESMCDACEERAIKARAALREFADQMPGRMWDYAVTATISALVRSLSLDGRCHLCGRHGNDHAEGCAVVRLAEVIE